MSWYRGTAISAIDTPIYGCTFKVAGVLYRIIANQETHGQVQKMAPKCNIWVKKKNLPWPLLFLSFSTITSHLHFFVL